MTRLTKGRRIFLLVITALWIFLEVLNGVSNYNDRTSWFQGLGAMIMSLFIIPPLVGLLYGAFEATGGLTKQRLGSAVIRMLAILIGRSVIGAAIYTATLHTEWSFPDRFLEYFAQTVPFTLGLGMLGFALSYLVAFAIDFIRKAPKGMKLARITLILIALMFFVLSLDAVFDNHPRIGEPGAIDTSYICMALLPTLLLTCRIVFGGATVVKSICSTLGLSVATVLIYLFGSLVQDLPLSDVGAVFGVIPISLAGCLLALAVRELIVRYFKKKHPEAFESKAENDEA